MDEGTKQRTSTSSFSVVVSIFGFFVAYYIFSEGVWPVAVFLGGLASVLLWIALENIRLDWVRNLYKEKHDG